jgi:hypothetical protein
MHSARSARRCSKIWNSRFQLEGPKIRYPFRRRYADDASGRILPPPHHFPNAKARGAAPTAEAARPAVGIFTMAAGLAHP